MNLSYNEVKGLSFPIEKCEVEKNGAGTFLIVDRSELPDSLQSTLCEQVFVHHKATQTMGHFWFWAKTKNKSLIFKLTGLFFCDKDTLDKNAVKPPDTIYLEVKYR